jgi:glutathione peroxidase
MKVTPFRILASAIAVILLSFPPTSALSQNDMSSFYDLSAETITGENFPFEQLRGKRVLIVNTASKCGYTKQYEGLQTLHEAHGGEDFIILGFPCNQFGGQEPGDAGAIATFCSKNYGVTFQMMDKVNVRGKECHDVFTWLCDEALNGTDKHSIRWNFHKFLIDADGKISASLPSSEEPMGEVITGFAGQ